MKSNNYRSSLFQSGLKHRFPNDTAVSEMRAAYKVGFKDSLALMRKVQ